MNETTLTALKASIAKWERNAVAKTPEDYLISAFDCPLCDLFIKDECRGCPVSEKTGRTSCEGSPYIDAVNTRLAWDYARDIFNSPKNRGQAARDAALKEVEFLKSLLPKEADI